MITVLKELQQTIKPIVLASTLFIISFPAMSAVTVSLTGSTTTTDISGFSGTAYQIGKSDGSRAVYGLWSVERRDNPCYIASMTEDVNNASDDSGGKKDLCGNDATSSQIKAQFSDAKFSDRTFIRSLRVCMNNGNTRVKGFQIKGRKIDSNGNVIDLPTDYPDSSSSSGLSALVDQNAPSDQRNHCNDNWKKWAKCPDGQIATALNAHYEAGSTPRSLTGIALKCRAVSK